MGGQGHSTSATCCRNWSYLVGSCNVVLLLLSLSLLFLDSAGFQLFSKRFWQIYANFLELLDTNEFEEFFVLP